jgi:hypothetical protein
VAPNSNEGNCLLPAEINQWANYVLTMSQLCKYQVSEKTLSCHPISGTITSHQFTNLAVSATLTVEEVLAGVLAWLLPLKWSVRRLTGH